jgi:anti-sigma B factor antagonist
MHLSTQVVGDVGVIHIDGEVDTVHAPELREAAERLLGDGARSLVIDCRAIEFIDSAGLQAMVQSFKAAQAQGGTVTVRDPSEFTLKLLRLSGLDEVLLIEHPAQLERGM